MKKITEITMEQAVDGFYVYADIANGVVMHTNDLFELSESYGLYYENIEITNPHDFVDLLSVLDEDEYMVAYFAVDNMDVFNELLKDYSVNQA